MATPTPLALYWVYQHHRYKTLQAALHLQQPVDATGLSNARVGAGAVRFIVDSADADAQLADYMFDP